MCIIHFEWLVGWTDNLIINAAVVNRQFPGYRATGEYHVFWFLYHAIKFVYGVVGL